MEDKIVKKVITLLLVFSMEALFGQTINFSQIPQSLQLYPRDDNNEAFIEIAGSISGGSYDSVYVEVFRGNSLWQRVSSASSGGSFFLQPSIQAGLVNYSTRIYGKTGSTSTLVAERNNIVAGDVYIISGQSNANYGYGVDDYSNEFCRSFGYMGNHNDYNPGDTTWGLATAEYDASDGGYYHVGSIAMELQQLIHDQYAMPTCFINGSAAGSELIDHLRNNGNPEDLSTIYGSLLYKLHKAGLADAVKAIVWHQGESNCFDDKWQNYESDFSELYDAWKSDYTGLSKIYTFQLRPGNCDVNHTSQRELREAQRKIGQFYSDVEVISNAGTSSFKNCHFWLGGYEQMSGWLFRLMQRDFYNSNVTENITSPDLQQAYFTDGNRNEIALVFDQPVVWSSDSTIDGTTHFMGDYFYLNGQYGEVVSGSANGSTLLLSLAGTSNANKITYLPNTTYNNGADEVYRGPWIRNVRGVGALSFHNVDIEVDGSIPAIPTGLRVTK